MGDSKTEQLQRETVLIHDDAPRSKWKMGIVINLYPGKYGLIRSAGVRKELSRPIEKLYPLELQTEDDHENDVIECTDEEPERLSRPVRRAAENALQKIKEQLQRTTSVYCN